jgi:hypothetical protein
MDTAANPVTATPVKPPRKGLLSPTNVRRWKNFKANRRGYWSLWLFLVLFVLCLAPSSSPTTGRSSPPTRARSCFLFWSTIPRRSSAASWPRPTTAPT